MVKQNPLLRPVNLSATCFVKESMMFRPSPDVDESFASFVAARSSRLVTHAYLLCGDAEKARDIVQGALARAYPSWHRIDRDDPYAYVAAAVTNAVTDWWRLAHRRHE